MNIKRDIESEKVLEDYEAQNTCNKSLQLFLLLLESSGMKDDYSSE